MENSFDHDKIMQLSTSNTRRHDRALGWSENSGVLALIGLPKSGGPASPGTTPLPRAALSLLLSYYAGMAEGLKIWGGGQVEVVMWWK